MVAKRPNSNAGSKTKYPNNENSNSNSNSNNSNNKNKKKIVGSKAKVWHGTADVTPGGKTKEDLTRNPKTNAIVFKSRREHGLKMYKKNKSVLDNHRQEYE